MGNRSKRIVRRLAAVATAGAVAGGLSFAGTAHASVFTKEKNGVVAQLDTHPGNGAASWVWGYAPYGVSYGNIQYQFYNGQVQSFNLQPHTSRSVNPSQDVWRVQACAVYVRYVKPPVSGPRDHDGYWYEDWQCSGWS
ncbi:hypothetical protein ACFFMR_04765 [Micromonospora andamanensis]|uniref:Lactococcin 972 family bacteriocin n=1 Tax=Micromonospora andamanensis TaxID=1287068 RepID=A0ABQ4I342_9ACTN|nr:hypothetical protein [Micromonospora andamanensis]GIJ12299.1 hypothetical protein Van01_55130 [Micromonospora andamanensis]